MYCSLHEVSQEFLHFHVVLVAREYSNVDSWLTFQAVQQDRLISFTKRPTQNVSELFAGGNHKNLPAHSPCESKPFPIL